jgi:hypothetical protein
MSIVAAPSAVTPPRRSTSVSFVGWALAGSTNWKFVATFVTTLSAGDGEQPGNIES